MWKATRAMKLACTPNAEDSAAVPRSLPVTFSWSTVRACARLARQLAKPSYLKACLCNSSSDLDIEAVVLHLSEAVAHNLGEGFGEP